MNLIKIKPIFRINFWWLWQPQSFCKIKYLRNPRLFAWNVIIISWFLNEIYNENFTFALGILNDQVNPVSKNHKSSTYALYGNNEGCSFIVADWKDALPGLTGSFHHPGPCPKGVESTLLTHAPNRNRKDYHYYKGRMINAYFVRMPIYKRTIVIFSIAVIIYFSYQKLYVVISWEYLSHVFLQSFLL